MLIKIKVLGLGAGDKNLLPIGVYQELLQASHLYLRTKEHPVVPQLEEEGVSFLSFDAIYEQFDQFEQVYEEIASALLRLGKEYGVIHYAVPGHPIVAERTVQLLLQQSTELGFEVELVGGQSFLDPLLGRLQVDPVEGLLFLDGTSLKGSSLHPECQTIITQVYDAYIASEVKLTLMEVFPDDHRVIVATAAGIEGQESILDIPLYELDRVATLSNLTALYVPPTTDEKAINRQYYQAREVFRRLRGEDGCPWDKKQTHQSLKKYLIEEAEEVLEAIDQDDSDHLMEELGDVLLQVFLHAQIAEDDGLFTMEDVIQSLNEKMIRRHPHVFGEMSLENSDEVIKQWDEIKKEEKEARLKKTRK
jgi:tetrapyrrole methylase family protein/MazG family protein